MADKRVGHKTQLHVSVTGATTAFTQIPCIIDGISGRGGDATEADVTCLDDTYTETRPTIIDSGEVSFSMIYDPGNAVNKTLTNLHGVYAPMPRWKVVYPVVSSTTEAQVSEEFDGWLKTLSEEIQRDNAISRSVSVRVSGNPGFTSA